MFAVGSLVPSTSTAFVIAPHSSPVTPTLNVTEAESPGPSVMGPQWTVAWAVPPGGMELAMTHGCPSNIGKGETEMLSASPGGARRSAARRWPARLRCW